MTTHSERRTAKEITVTITLDSGLKTSQTFRTEAAAMAARDRAHRLGFTQVAVTGLPERLVCVG